MKSKFAPLQVDATTAILYKPRVANGSIVRGYAELNVYKKGISLRLVEVQIKTLVTYAAADPDRPRTSNAKPVDGYVADAQEPEGSDDGDDEPQTKAGSALDI